MPTFDYLGLRPSVLSYLFDIQEKQGYIKAMFAGDSMMEGVNYNMGCILPTILALQQFGLEVQMVGDREVTTAAQARFVLEGYGGKHYQQTHGTIKTIELLNGFLSGSTLLGGGTANWTLTAFKDSLVTNKPDIVFMHIGTNDTASATIQAQMESLYKNVYDYNPNCPVVHFLPLASISTTSKTYTVDSARRAVALNAYDAARNSPAKVIMVNCDKALAPFTWNPNRDATTATNFGSTQIWYDGTHLNEEGNAICAALGVARITGASQMEVLRRLSEIAPYSPVPFEYGADVAAAASGEIKDSTAGRKLVLTSFSATNIGGSTATVTLQRTVQRQDGATTGETTTTSFAFKVPAGATRGWTWPMDGNTAETATGPVAHYNTGWDVSVTTADCNIQATGFAVMA